MLKVSKLTLGFNKKPILNIDSFSVKKNETLLITGVSGSGKTTLLYAICGINKPIKGDVEIDGTNVFALNNKSIDEFRGKNIGIIFQTLHLLNYLTVFENVQLANYFAGVNAQDAKIDSILRILGILELKNKKIHYLSQGQKQRVAIARAVINNPKVIVADEPTSSLDDTSCDKTIDLLKAVASDIGSSLVIATHDSRLKTKFKNIINIG